MGTHPIFESDFDCLTDSELDKYKKEKKENENMIKEVLTIVLLGFADAQKSVKLKNVDVLTLYAGRMTTGRRSAPVPQLECMGGSAGCSAFVPTVVQCYNRGTDGQDIQWECKADMEMKYKFGQIQVTCEGFDYPDDPYVLAGSCGLEYTIDRVGSSSSYSSNTGGTSFWSSSSSNTDSSEEGLYPSLSDFFNFF